MPIRSAELPTLSFAGGLIMMLKGLLILALILPPAILLAQSSPSYYNIVADGGAVCDGLTDDTAAIQSIYSRMTSLNQGTILWPTNRGCKVTGTITLANAQSVQVFGGRVIWSATSANPVFRYANDRNVETKGFYISPSPGFSIGTAFQIEEDKATRYGISSGNVFTANVIEGVRPGGLNIGFEMKQGGAGDVNNDEMRFYGNEVRNYTTAGWQIDHTQSKDHNFFGNQCYGNGTGAACVSELAGSRIHWVGGFTGGNTDADFILRNNASQPQSIEGITSEGSNRFVRYGIGPFGGPAPLNLIDDDFSTNRLNPDKHIVLYYGPGPLNVLGGNYGRATNIGNFYWAPCCNVGMVFGSVTGVSFSAPGSNAILPLVYGTNSPHIFMGGNTFVNSSGLIALPMFSYTWVQP
jgi:hypothetical protein